MADFFPVKTSLSFRLNAGAHPETGRDILKTVSISRVDPDFGAPKFAELKALIEPMFEYPVADARRHHTDLVEA